MKKLLLTGLLAAALPLAVSAQDAPQINKVWEYLNTSTNSPLPILKVTAPDTRSTGDAGQGEGPLNGMATNDSYGGFKRYDATRLLLGIRENGIDETAAGHDAALAAQFPDRSLIWINPSDGSPMGVALVVGQTPAPVSDEFVQLQVANGRGLNGGVGPAEYFNFGVSEDGMIYVGYFYHILRYAPDGSGGFSAPTVAYSFNNGEKPTPDLDRWDQWRFEDIEVTGAGADTVIIANGKTWRPSQNVQILTTTDGMTFTDSVESFGGGGGHSKIREVEGDRYIYAAQYPGSGGGPSNTFKRFYFDGAIWAEDPLFSVQVEDTDGIAESKGDYINDVEVSDEFPNLLFGLATPSYGAAALPGWINIYEEDFEGGPSLLVSSYKHDVTKLDEPYDTSGEQLPFWFGTMGDIDVNHLSGYPDGAAEILWYSGLYGYGRYTIGDVPTSVSEWSLF